MTLATAFVLATMAGFFAGRAYAHSLSSKPLRKQTSVVINGEMYHSGMWSRS